MSASPGSCVTSTAPAARTAPTSTSLRAIWRALGSAGESVARACAVISAQPPSQHPYLASVKPPTSDPELSARPVALSRGQRGHVELENQLVARHQALPAADHVHSERLALVLSHRSDRGRERGARHVLPEELLGLVRGFGAEPLGAPIPISG